MDEEDEDVTDDVTEFDEHVDDSDSRSGTREAEVSKGSAGNGGVCDTAAPACDRGTPLRSAGDCNCGGMAPGHAICGSPCECRPW